MMPRMMTHHALCDASISKQGEFIMNDTKTASGLFSLKVKENGGAETTVPTDFLQLSLSPDSLHLSGHDSSTKPPPWGAALHISIPISPGRYNVTPRSGTYYNPKNVGTSWSATTGEITLAEVDFEKKLVKGSFNFTAADGNNAEHTAEVSGTFSLSN